MNETTKEFQILYKKIDSVLLPIEFVNSKYCGELKGIYNEATGVFNVIHTSFCSADKRVTTLGKIVDTGSVARKKIGKQKFLLGVWENEHLIFYQKGKKIEYKTYSIESDITSRNKGIVDNIHLKDSYAVIVGCGSVGSFIALELAKSGVGNFILVDDDIFAYHNISRHQCGIYDVGKRKIDALEERIFQLNPTAKVKTYFNIIQDVFTDDLEQALCGNNGIIINCGDNRQSSYYSNFLAMKLNLYFIAVAAAYMASYGELFWHIPNKGLPCYGCLYGKEYNVTNNNETIRHWYASEEHLAKNDFIPALAVDIDYISIIATKFVLELLMLNFKNYKLRYIKSFTQFMLISNFISDANNNTALNITAPLQVIKVSIKKQRDCIVCKGED